MDELYYLLACNLYQNEEEGQTLHFYAENSEDKKLQLYTIDNWKSAKKILFDVPEHTGYSLFDEPEGSGYSLFESPERLRNSYNFIWVPWVLWALKYKVPGALQILK